jgi:Protein of unknown function (DUF3224)
MTRMPPIAKGTFDGTLQPGADELDGAVRRFELTKTFHGAIEGSGAGIMLSGGDPQTPRYGVVPGSGRDELAGITGALHLDIDHDGTHRYELEYDL